MGINFNNISSDTPKKYKFVFDSEFDTKTLKTAPLEWASASIKFSRDSLFDGVFTEYIADKLTFIKSEYLYLKDIYAASGLFSKCDLLVYYYDYNTLTYIQFPTAFELDFNTYRVVKITKAIEGIEIKPLPIGLLSKLNKRRKTKVDLTQLTSIGELELTDYTSLPSNLRFPAINAYRTAKFNSTDTNQFSLASGTETVTCPTTEISSDFSETDTVLFAQDVVIGHGNALFSQSTQNRTLVFIGTVNFKFDSTLRGTLNFYTAKVEVGGALVGSVTQATYTAGATGSKSFTIDETYALTTGESLVLYASGFATHQWEFSYVSNELQISEAVVQSPLTATHAFPLYEALERNLQLILDLQFPLYSTKFGRTDVVKNAAGDFYASESSLTFGSVINGLSVRGLALADETNTVAVTFEDLFKSLKAIYNIGGGFETAESEDRFVIEDWTYFYVDSVGLDLSARIDANEVEEEVLPEYAYSQIKTGFKAFLYEDINGRGEYNVKNEFTTRIPNDNVFDNVSPYRADTRGLTLLLENAINTTGTTDVKGDNDIFIVKSQSGGVNWIAETDELIKVLNDTSMFQDGSFNLIYSPKRNLIRHLGKIMSGLDKSPASIVQFQTSDKDAQLETSDGIVGPTHQFVENDDLNVSDLGDPRWNPKALIWEGRFFEADYITLKNNLKKLVRLATGKEGWILEADYKYTENKIKLKLLEKWA